MLQPLPMDEVETDASMGYNGADYFSPDFPYRRHRPGGAQCTPGHHQWMLADKGFPPLACGTLARTGSAEGLVDLCHVYGIAVAFDVVYNHAGGFTVDGTTGR